MCGKVVDGERERREKKDGKEGNFCLQWRRGSPNTSKFSKYKNLSPDLRAPNRCLIFVALIIKPPGMEKKGREGNLVD